MLQRIHDPERGASHIEYGAVILLVAAIFSVVVNAGIGERITRLVEDAVDSAASGGPSDSGADPADTSEEEPANTSEEGAPEGTEDTPGRGGDAPEAAPTFDENEAEPTAGPAVSDGSGDTHAKTAEWAGDAWDWATGDQPAFQFEDRGDYNWDCGWVLDGFCKLGGGAYQGTRDVSDGLVNLGCHLHLCSHENFKETWDQTKDAAAKVATQSPRTTAGEMWEGFTEPFRENLENNTPGNGFLKNLGYSLPAAVGGAFKPLGFLDKPPGSSGSGGGSSGSNGSGNEGQEGATRADGEESGSGGRGDEDRNNNGTNCSPSSFVPGTPVLAADGSAVPIEEIEVGDQVWAFDPLTGKEGPRAVTHLLTSSGEKILVDLTVTDGTGQSAEFTATDEHPFWLPEAGAWVEAADLDLGTWLRTSTGTWAQISAVQARAVPDQRVHNLTVDDLHTYYVGEGENTVLVHNSDCFETTAGEAIDFLKPTQNTRTWEQEAQLEDLSNEDLLKAIEDPKDGDEILVMNDGRQLGGHHRIDELRRRVEDGRISPDTDITLQWYDPEDYN